MEHRPSLVSTSAGALRAFGSPATKMLKKVGGDDDDDDDDNEMVVDKADIPLADRIQLAFRTLRSLYADHGHDIFCMKNGDACFYGQLDFGVAVKDPTIPPAPFMVVSDLSSSAHLAKTLIKSWALEMPEVLLTITGSAQDLVLPPALQQSFEAGLASVATSSRAWIFSGGTNTGVMKLLGDFKFRHRDALQKVPFIGIAPWGCVNNRTPIVGARGATVQYTGAPADRFGAPLNPHHTHFLLIDSGKGPGEAWGSETRMRSMLENRFMEGRRVPGVLLVVQGGPGTVDAILASMEEHIPVVLLVDSGGAATATAEYFAKLETWRTHFSSSLPREKLDKIGGTLGKIADLQRRSSGRLVHPFRLSSGEELSNVIMQAIISNMRMRPPPAAKLGTKIPFDQKKALAGLDEAAKRKQAEAMALDLTLPVETQPLGPLPVEENDSSGILASEMDVKAMNLAISWDRPDVVELILAKQGAKVASSSVATRGLQRALEMRRGSIVERLLRLPDLTASTICMAKLYAVKDEYGFLAVDRRLQKKLTKRLSEIHSAATSPEEKHAIYKKAVVPSLAAVSSELGALCSQGKLAAMHDVFLWLTIQGDDDLALVCWRHCRKPLHLALLGARLCKAMASRVFKGKEELLARAVRYEQWALDTMNEAPDEVLAFRILRSGVIAKARADQTLLDLALNCEMKPFLFQRHCRSLMSSWWRGGFEGAKCNPLHPQFSWLVLALRTVVPFVNPYLYSAQGPKDTRKWDGKQRKNISLQAVSAAMGLILEERQKARGKSKGKGADAAASSANAPASSDDAGGARSSSLEAHFRKDAVLKKQKSYRDKKGGCGDAIAAALLDVPLISRTVSFYSIPAVKFLTRFLVHLTFLTVYIVLIFTQPDRAVDEAPPGFRSMETLWLVFEVGLFLDQQHQKIVHRRIGHRRHSNIFTYLWLMVDFILVLAVACRVATLVIDPTASQASFDLAVLLWDAYIALISVNSFVITNITLSFTSQLYEKLGVLVIILEGMLLDMILFLALFIIINLGFSSCFYGLARASFLTFESDADLLSPDFGALSIPFWAGFGAFSLAGHTWTSSILLFTCCVSSNIVLINLLIAMFSDTYVRIKEKAEIEHTFQRYLAIFEHRHVLNTIPPVLNLPFLVVDAFLGCCDSKRWLPKIQGGEGGEGGGGGDDDRDGQEDGMMLVELAARHADELEAQREERFVAACQAALDKLGPTTEATIVAAVKKELDTAALKPGGDIGDGDSETGGSPTTSGVAPTTAGQRWRGSSGGFGGLSA